MALLAATWKTAYPAVEEWFPKLLAGLSPEDAVEGVVCFVEDCPEEHSVGYGAWTTNIGTVELDAAFMEGKNRTIGGVSCVQDIKNPVKLARLVMNETPHNLLVGEGAMAFAAARGVEKRKMLTEEAWSEYQEFLKGNRKRNGHDTVGVIGRGEDGHFAVAMSTSGLEYRMPGRVSDSAVPACGYFCDDEIGAAVCTGVGEDIMRGALAGRALDYLLQGESAENAAKRVVADVNRRLRGLGNMAIIVADKAGRWGAAANHGAFSVSVAESGAAPANIPIAKLDW